MSERIGPKKFRICWVANSIAGTGGNSERIRLWLKYIDKSRFSVDFIYGPRESRDLRDFFLPHNLTGINLIPERTLSRSNIRHYKGILKLRKLFQERNYDIIHSLRSASDIWTAISLKGQVHKSKVIAHIAGKKSPNSPIISILYDKVYGFIKRDIDLHISISEYNKHELIEKYGIAPEKILVLPIGIDFLEFKPKKINKDTLSFGFAGRFIETKGIKYLLKGIQKGLQNVKDKELEFILAGDGELFRYTSSWIKKQQMSDYVKLLGWVNNMAEFYNQIDVLILPSLSEGTPRSILEAYFFEIPVIATDVGGVSEIVKHGLTGFLIPPRDSEGIAKYIEYFIQKSTNIEQMGKVCKEYVLKNHNVINEVRQLEKIYLSLLNITN